MVFGGFISGSERFWFFGISKIFFFGGRGSLSEVLF